MARPLLTALFRIALVAPLAAAQLPLPPPPSQQKELKTRPPVVEEPPEEDEAIKPAEYTLNPLQAQKEFRTGNFYFKKGSWKAAAARYAEAALWDPSFAEAFLKLGETKEKQKDAKAAAEAYSKYVALQPDTKRAAELKKKYKLK